MHAHQLVVISHVRLAYLAHGLVIQVVDQQSSCSICCGPGASPLHLTAILMPLLRAPTLGGTVSGTMSALPVCTGGVRSGVLLIRAVCISPQIFQEPPGMNPKP